MQIKFQVNPIYEHIDLNYDKYNTIVNQGGTRSGKTYNTLIFLITKAQEIPAFAISVVSQSLPHLKKGAIRDFLQIMQHYGLYENNRWNKTDYIYTFANNSYLEFFSADNDGKVRGPSRDLLFVNEANTIGYEIYRQLLIRTRGKVIIDFNPVEPEHWIYDNVIPEKDTKLLISTYKDNLAYLPEKQVNLILREGEKDENFKRVFVDGKRGAYIKGQVFKEKWRRISDDKLPDYEKFYGLDFGYSQDPCACVQIQKHNSNLYLHEIMYEPELTNRMIAGRLKQAGITDEPIYCDSAEPKSIDELKYFGINAKPAVKGPDSINAGIKKIREHIIYYTGTSKNLEREKLFYKYALDKEDKPTNKPVDTFNHLMDAVRYGLMTHTKNIPKHSSA